MDKHSLLKRFNDDPAQKLLFSKVLDRFFLSDSQRTAFFTDFYDPVSRTRYADALACCGRDVVIRAFGGSEECERQMLGFAPSIDLLAHELFPIACVRVAFNRKFHKPPRHQDLLGAILGLGIDRSRVGDIFVAEDGAEAFAHMEIAEYIASQLHQAGRVPVKAEVVTHTAISSHVVLADKTLTVASLRLDAVIAAAYHLSRGQASALITSERVFLNWRLVTEPGKLLREQDMISVRGQGRVQLAAVAGKTKKDRIRITIRS